MDTEGNYLFGGDKSNESRNECLVTSLHTMPKVVSHSVCLQYPNRAVVRPSSYQPPPAHATLYKTINPFPFGNTLYIFQI